jgi:hypothetical protein
MFLRVVYLITSREKTLESIQYLQSLRAIVDNPPPTPTRSLAKTQAPSIDKVTSTKGYYLRVECCSFCLWCHCIEVLDVLSSCSLVFFFKSYVRL